MGTANLNVGIITQVRMNSSRLPGKVLMEVNGKSLLRYHIDRLKKTGFELIIATTLNSSDDRIEEFARENAIKCFRGFEQNVLSRYYEAATKFNLGIIVRVTSDCPFIDPDLIKESVGKYKAMKNSRLYFSNVIERTYARGFDFEVFSYELLKEAFDRASEQSDLEHVTTYIRKNINKDIEFVDITQPSDQSRFRLTVDTQDDFNLVKKLIEEHDAANLTYSQIENLLKIYPELSRINAHVEQKRI